MSLYPTFPSRRTRSAGLGALAAALLLSGCVSIPTGPSVASFPGSNRSFDQFRVDEADCRRYASDSIGGSDPTQAQADSAVKSAAVGTVVFKLYAPVGDYHTALYWAGWLFIPAAAIALLLPQEKDEPGMVDEPVE